MRGNCFILLHVCVILFSFLLGNCQQRQVCTTPNGDSATCISVYDCRHFLRAIKNKIPAQLEFIKRSQCGFTTTPLVCCGSTVDFAGVRAAPTGRASPETTRSFTRSSAIPDRRMCGKQESDKSIAEFIFHGTETKLKEFPWMALLGYSDRLNRLRWACGGTIISSRYILTAAHCVTGEVLRQVGNLVYVKLGEHNVKTDIDCDKNGECNESPVIAGVERVIFHEKYDAEDKTSPYDIALIRLNQRLTFTDFIRPICLPETNESSSPGDYLTTAGWGLIENHQNTDFLLKVEVPYHKNDDCNSAFRSATLKLLDSQVCAGGEDGRDSCSGDSGGPLMRRTVSDTFQWYQEGIVSFGDSRCGIKGLPGIYTKVASFLPWIHSHVTD